MTRKVKVVVRWLLDPPPHGVSHGIRFAKPARFDHQGDDWGNNAWSVVVTTEGNPDENGEQMANAEFLVIDAPQDWLSIGRSFALYDREPLATAIVKEILSEK